MYFPLRKSGLEFVIAADGTSEWVRPEDKDRFKREGKTLLGTESKADVGETSAHETARSLALALAEAEARAEAAEARAEAAGTEAKAETEAAAKSAANTAVGVNGAEAAARPPPGASSTTVILKEDHASTHTSSGLVKSQGSAETQKLDHASSGRVAQQLEQHQQHMEQLMTRNVEQINQIKSDIFEMKKEQASKGKSNNGRGLTGSALIKRIISKTGRMRKQGPRVADRGQSIEPNAEAAGRLHSARL